jgi:hypothetical protein
MLKKNEDAIIVRPEELANAYGDYLLITGEDGKPEPGTSVPESVLMRYEPSKELLYIDKRVFRWLELEETLKVWRKSQQYCGPMVKRMTTGTGRVESPQNVLVFDLSEKPDERTAPIRPRRGRPLTVERERARQDVAKIAEQNALSVHRRLAELKIEYGNQPIIKEIEIILKEAKHILEEAHAVAGRRRTRGRGKKKAVVPIDQRVKVEALDAFLKENIHAVHRILKRFVKTGGKQKYEDKNFRPRLPPTDWIGRYEEVSDEVTGHTTKTLFVPVSVLKSMKELKGYERDFRFVRKKYRLIGSATLRCAVFDFGRRIS